MAGNIRQIQTSDEVLHDLEVDLTNYYDKSETDTLLGAKADSSSVYTKSETDLLLADKADKTDIYTKSQLDALFDSKANVNTVYTKGETDLLLTAKADVATTYTKTETDNLLLTKANSDAVYPKSETYNRTQIGDLLATKADSSSVYSKSDVDSALALKANSADVYTISQTDGLLAEKAEIDDSTTTATMKTWSASKLNTEFQNVPKLDVANEFTAQNTLRATEHIKCTNDIYTDGDSDTVLQFEDNTGNVIGDISAYCHPITTGTGLQVRSIDEITLMGSMLYFNSDNVTNIRGEVDRARNYYTTEKVVGYLNDGTNDIPIYRKIYIADSVDYSGTFSIDSNLKSTDVIMFNCGGAIKINSPSNEWLALGGFNGGTSPNIYSIMPQLVSTGFNLMYSWATYHCTNYKIWIEYIKIS